MLTQVVVLQPAAVLAAGAIPRWSRACTSTAGAIVAGLHHVEVPPAALVLEAAVQLRDRPVDPHPAAVLSARINVQHLDGQSDRRGAAPRREFAGMALVLEAAVQLRDRLADPQPAAVLTQVEVLHLDGRSDRGRGAAPGRGSAGMGVVLEAAVQLGDQPADPHPATVLNPVEVPPV